MEQIQAKLVNKGFSGEPENIVLQTLESLQMFDFSQIKSVYNNYGSFYTKEEVLSSKYENRLFVKINDEK